LIDVGSLADRARAAQIAGRLQYLLALDSVWMAEIAQGQPRIQVEAISMVKDQLMTTLATLRSDVPFIRGLASDLDQDAVGKSLSHPQVPKEVLLAFRRVADRRGGFGTFASEQLGTLDAVLADIETNIISDLDRVRAAAPRTIRGGSDSTGVAIGVGLIVTGIPAAEAAGILLVILSA